MRQLAEAAPLLQAQPATNGADCVLLYIEDNLSNSQLVEAILSTRQGTRLLTAIQGSVGLDLARQHRPDLILLDLHLPDMSGREVLRRLRASRETARTPIVVLSADATPGQIANLLNPPGDLPRADAYLTKPLNVREFIRVLDEFLAGEC
jgi:CheY-like chemotaxis protein